MNKQRSIDTLTVESTVLGCNFVNTIYAWRGVNLHEYLQSYDDVIAWCRKLNVLDEAAIQSLAVAAKQNPAGAEEALATLKTVREKMYHLISAIAGNEAAAALAALAELDPWLKAAASRQQLIYENGKFTAAFGREQGDLLAPLWPVLISLRDLLLTAEPARVKECPTCGWVFLDETKNGRRRWCSPIECGTQDKMRRYNARKKQEAGSQES